MKILSTFSTIFAISLAVAKADKAVDDVPHLKGAISSAIVNIDAHGDEIGVGLRGRSGSGEGGCTGLNDGCGSAGGCCDGLGCIDNYCTKNCAPEGESCSGTPCCEPFICGDKKNPEICI